MRVLAGAVLAVAIAFLTLVVSAALGVTGSDPIETVPGTVGTNTQPVGVAVRADGRLIVSERGSGVVFEVRPDGGREALLSLAHPFGVAIDPSGSVYVADASAAPAGVGSGAHRVVKWSPGGAVTTVAGTGVKGSTGDGGPATSAALNTPQGVAVDDSGAVYISEFYGARVRRVAPDGTITTFAGTGTEGFSGDGGLATSARLRWPVGLAIGRDGSVYIADYANHRVRRVAPDGVITTVAGTGAKGSGGDGGPAVAAQLDSPAGLAVGSDGTVYVSEFGGDRVRAISPAGTISTVAGTGAPGGDGDGGPAGAATLQEPIGLALSRRGDLHIADSANHRVRRIINTLPPVGASGARCADAGPAPKAAPPRRRAARRGPVKVTPRQLLINQRISQAAVRRLNAVRAWLDAGLTGGDICGGSIGAADLMPAIVTEEVANGNELPVASPRPVTPAQPPRRGRAPRLRLSPRQLLINQRVSQAAVRRANALEARLQQGLTGGDIRPGAIGQGHLQSNLGIRAAGASARPAASRTILAKPGRGRPGRVRVEASQLRINQRISQAAVRRANALIHQLAQGLTGEYFRDGSIATENLAPELRGS